MANDPNRDILPVKEGNGIIGKGLCERAEHRDLYKLSRWELGGKVLNLLDEKDRLKKQLNCQEEASKRLRTKLQRLTGESKDKHKPGNHSVGNEELNLRIIGLEHENYTLKDKNTVLRQQLASHSRHFSIHHSPFRSAYTSPLISVRQSAPPQKMEVYNTSAAAELNTADAELHIKQLNAEIKSLHCKIDYLQRDIEKSSLNNRKTKVTENIELIRLQRSLKQQAIQIETLQAQVRTSENNQKLLREELIRAHDENDDAMNLISVKQNEILTLCAQLEKKNLNRFREEEMRERINDLMKERDALKERSEYLIQKIGSKGKEARQTENLKKLLAEEKSQKQDLETKLKKMEILLRKLQECNRCGVAENGNCSCKAFPQPLGTNLEKSFLVQRKKDNMDRSSDVTEPEEPESGATECSTSKGTTICHAPADGKLSLSPTYRGSACAFDTYTGEFSVVAIQATESSPPCSGSHGEISQAPEEVTGKLKMERELQYLREMLRSQTTLCAAQKTEIGRLTNELKVNEDKYNTTLQRLESYLKVFETSQQQQKREQKSDNLLIEAVSQGRQLPDVQDVSEPGGNAPKNALTRSSQFDSKKRFIDQVFLESSDEEDANDEKMEKATLMRKLETLENEVADVDTNKKITQIGPGLSNPHSNRIRETETPRDHADRKPSGDLPPDFNTNPSGNKLQWPEGPKYKKTSPIKSQEKEDIIQIGIVWLQVDTACAVWKNDHIKFLFVDFSFLDMKGEETETPDSLRKPKTSKERCQFEFYKDILMTEKKKIQLKAALRKPELDLIVFKVVSEPEQPYEDSECEDIGVAVVTVKQFLHSVNNGPFVIPIENVNNFQEVIGRLGVSVSAAPGLLGTKS